MYLNSISSLRLSILIPMGIGLVLGGFLFLKLIQKLLTKHSSETYYGIIGFVLGSIPILYPGFTFDTTGVLSIFCFLACFGIGYCFEKK